jgi:mitochondrial fission protein ELM1
MGAKLRGEWTSRQQVRAEDIGRSGDVESGRRPAEEQTQDVVRVALPWPIRRVLGRSSGAASRGATSPGAIGSDPALGVEDRSMALVEFRSRARFLNPKDPRRDACVRSRPECVVLGVKGGAVPSGKPPVRIFLGTEPAQYRAERVFVWSIERVRDPSRVYEIYLMKDLEGFDRRGWTTGFTNYRFAIPHLAGAAGRAIFNDVDEAYFGDPAELFDLELGGCGYLATSDTETSVMLIDCARMAPVWTLEAARHQLKKQLLARALEIPGIRGDLPPEWTARDADFVPGRSKLQHWTTLHTQPWRPVPGRFVYEPNPTGQLWFDLKQGADRAGFQVFDARRPSAGYTGLLERLREAPRPPRAGSASRRREAVPGEPADALAKLVEQTGARGILQWELGRAADVSAAGWIDGADAEKLEVGYWDMVHNRDPQHAAERFDGVVCTDVLEFLPEEDAPWVVDTLFARARRFVYARVAVDGRSEVLTDRTRLDSLPRDGSWWIEHFETASRRHPQLHWRLVLTDRSRRGARGTRIRDGGRLPGPPKTWVLSDEARRDSPAPMALARALGWPCRRKELRFTPLARLSNRLLGASRLGLTRAGRAGLEPPWPDVVIATGRQAVPVARWIRERSRGRTRLVQLGAGGERADLFDAAVTPAHHQLWPHPRRIETAAPLVPATGDPPDGPAPAVRAGAAPPRIALLAEVGRGSGSLHGVYARRMARAVRGFAESVGGSAFAVVGPRTASAAAAELGRALGEDEQTPIRRLGALGSDDALAQADAIVVSGDDEAMLARAAASGRPVYIHPPSGYARGPLESLRSWVDERARRRPVNARGTPRPQQGVEYLCARLIERGIVRPPRDLGALHAALYRLGIARPFGTPYEPWARATLRPAAEIARDLRPLLGFS